LLRELEQIRRSHPCSRKPVEPLQIIKAQRHFVDLDLTAPQTLLALADQVIE